MVAWRSGCHASWDAPICPRIPALLLTPAFCHSAPWDAAGEGSHHPPARPGWVPGSRLWPAPAPAEGGGDKVETVPPTLVADDLHAARWGSAGFAHLQHFARLCQLTQHPPPSPSR